MVEVHVTFPNAAEANALSRAAVEQRLAACASVMGAMHSYFWWAGALQSEDEVAVVFKTADDRESALVAFLAAHHSYEVPAIIVHQPRVVVHRSDDIAAG